MVEDVLGLQRISCKSLGNLAGNRWIELACDTMDYIICISFSLYLNLLVFFP